MFIRFSGRYDKPIFDVISVLEFFAESASAYDFPKSPQNWLKIEIREFSRKTILFLLPVALWIATEGTLLPYSRKRSYRIILIIRRLTSTTWWLNLFNWRNVWIEYLLSVESIQIPLEMSSPTTHSPRSWSRNHIQMACCWYRPSIEERREKYGNQRHSIELFILRLN